MLGRCRRRLAGARAHLLRPSWNPEAHSNDLSVVHLFTQFTSFRTSVLLLERYLGAILMDSSVRISVRKFPQNGSDYHRQCANFVCVVEPNHEGVVNPRLFPNCGYLQTASQQCDTFESTFEERKPDTMNDNLIVLFSCYASVRNQARGKHSIAADLVSRRAEQMSVLFN
eukprot:1495947-Amphidinium_carterae.1